MESLHIALFVTVLLGDAKKLSTQDLTRGCLPGYERLEPESNCYQFVTGYRKWNDAKNWCSEDGETTALVEIQSQEEQSSIVKALKQKGMMSVWTGGNDIAVEGIWEWHNTPIGPYWNWDSRSPYDGHGNEDCIELHKNSDFKWDDVSCDYRNQFVCEQDTAGDHETPSKCMGGWEDLNNDENCYMFVRKAMYWFDAVSMCRDFGGYLIEVDSEAEQSTISNRLRWKSIFGIWLGASDIVEEGLWQWQSDSRQIIGYKHWDTTNPSNTANKEHCLAIREVEAYWWNDLDCYTNLTVVCENSCNNTMRNRTC